MSWSCTFDFSCAHTLVVGAASRSGIRAAIARAFQEAGAAAVITGAESEPEAFRRWKRGGARLLTRGSSSRNQSVVLCL